MEKDEWNKAWEHLHSLEDNEWDKESERLDDQWISEYQDEFVRHALQRGWNRFDAATWATEIARDALVACRHRDTPQDAAHTDVEECERE